MHPPLDPSALAAVPLFPLPRVVFFPDTLLPLHVFEPRYRELVSDAIDGAGLVAVPLLSAGWESAYTGSPSVHPICGLGMIVRRQALPDGRSNIVLLGRARVRIAAELDVSTPYRQARVELLPAIDPPAGDPAWGVAWGRLRALLGQVIRARPTLADDLRPLLDGSRPVGEVLHQLAHMVLSDVGERQRFLEENDPVRRAARVEDGVGTVLSQIMDETEAAEA